jgi:hypothetical protein
VLVAGSALGPAFERQIDLAGIVLSAVGLPGALDAILGNDHDFAYDDHYKNKAYKREDKALPHTETSE